MEPIHRQPPTPEQVREAIVRITDRIRDMLLEKNKNYGNSALDPLRICSKASPLEQINVRMDDKLSRIERGLNAGEDPEWDLIGYLVLKRAGFDLGFGSVEDLLSDEQVQKALKILCKPTSR